jgi:hypothetical protein
LLTHNAASLADLYEGAVVMLYESILLGRTRFIGHAVREIRNRLPDAFAGRIRGQRLNSGDTIITSHSVPIQCE